MEGQPSKYQRNFNSVRCRICEGFDYDTAEHILFTCEALEPYRNNLWDNVLSKMTEPLKQGIMNMIIEDKVKFILSCCGECYIDEWTDVYKSIADFVYKMYVHRALLYDNMN